MSKLYHSQIIKLKDQKWLERQRIAGQCVAQVFENIEKILDNPNISLIDLENIAIDTIKSYNCTATFKGYRGFPSYICVSINKQLVHGIVKNVKLEVGDLVSIDLGATYEGAIADAARTYIYGEPKSGTENLVESCRKSLDAAIDSIKIDRRLGIIGETISKFARETGFGVITGYGGHGIDYNKPHSSPFVSNRGQNNQGIRLKKGLTLAIEPMFVIGNNTETVLDEDGWTVWTKELSAHFEDTIFIHEEKVEIITRKNANI